MLKAQEQEGRPVSMDASYANGIFGPKAAVVQAVNAPNIMLADFSLGC